MTEYYAYSNETDEYDRFLERVYGYHVTDAMRIDAVHAALFESEPSEVLGRCTDTKDTISSATDLPQEAQ